MLISSTLEWGVFWTPESTCRFDSYLRITYVSVRELE